MAWSAAAAAVAAIITTVSSMGQQQAANRQANYQAEVAAANAQALRNQSETESQAARVKIQEIESEKEQIGRQFRHAQGKNIATMAASGAEVTTGSALDLLEGNIDLFSQDVGTNLYQQKLTNWESRTKQRQLNWQADVQDSQASFYHSTVQSSGQSLLTSGLKGLGAGFSTYAAFGGGNPFSSGATKGATGAAGGLHMDKASAAKGLKFNF